MVKSVCIYRSVAGLASEAFIAEQVSSYKRYDPFILSRRLLDGGLPGNIKCIAPKSEREKLESAALVLAGYSRFFESSIVDNGSVLVHAHFGPDANLISGICRSLGLPLVVTCHGFDVHSSSLGLVGSLRPSFIRYALQRVSFLNSCDRVIAVSKAIENMLLAKGVKREKIKQIYIGVDPNKFRYRRAFYDGKFKILNVARHVEYKGIDFLLQSLAIFKRYFSDFSLTQVGSGPLTSKLKALVAELGLKDNVNFVGSLPHCGVSKLMGESSVLVLSSHDAGRGAIEALGVVLNEASASCLPVVCTSNGGMPEAVVDNETGFVVPERDSFSIAERLLLLAKSSKLRVKMGRYGRDFVFDRFNICRQTELIESVYDDLV